MEKGRVSQGDKGEKPKKGKGGAGGGPLCIILFLFQIIVSHRILSLELVMISRHR